MLRWKRTLRTYSSERFVALRDRREVATADLHYLLDGTVSGTIVLDRAAGWAEVQIPDLLAALDEDLLPSVDQAAGNLHYTVIIGDKVGSFDPGHDPAPSRPSSAGKPGSAPRKRK
jgi:hypothetical protein